MSTEIDQWIAEIRARNAARTQGTWYRDGNLYGTEIRCSDTRHPICSWIANEPDVDFIARAPDDIAFLLAQLDHRNALIERTGRILAATLTELETLKTEVDKLLAVVKAQEGEL